MMDLSHSLLMALVKLVDGCAGVLFSTVTYEEWVSVWYPKVNNSHIMATHFLPPFTHLFSHIKNIDHLSLIILPAKHLKPFVTCEACFCAVHLSVNILLSLCYSCGYCLHISHILLLYSRIWSILLHWRIIYFSILYLVSGVIINNKLGDYNNINISFISYYN